MKPIRILLVDDQASIRRGLRMRLELEDDMEVVGEAASGDEALRIAAEAEPDVALMDVEMPGKDGISATRELTAATPHCSVVMLSIHDDPGTRAAARAAGARAFVAKHEAGDLLLQTIRSVARTPARVEEEDTS
jgi:DNA-binding NarL/FixJ family response regulator